MSQRIHRLSVELLEERTPHAADVGVNTALVAASLVNDPFGSTDIAAIVNAVSVEAASDEAVLIDSDLADEVFGDVEALLSEPVAANSNDIDADLPQPIQHSLLDLTPAIVDRVFDPVLGLDEFLFNDDALIGDIAGDIPTAAGIDFLFGGFSSDEFADDDALEEADEEPRAGEVEQSLELELATA